MIIAHIYENHQEATKALMELPTGIGVSINTTNNTASYNGVVLRFVALTDVARKLAGTKLDSVKYHGVEPDESTELFLLGRMNV
jgi:hypothetical protein